MYQNNIKALFLFVFLVSQLHAQEQTTPSSKAQMINKTLRAVNFSEKAFDKLLNKPIRGSNKVAAKKMTRGLLTEERDIDGYNILTIQKSTALNKHIIVLHGGAYVSEGIKGHRLLMEKLALDYDFKVSFIDYPLAPENQASYTHEILGKAFDLLCKENEDDEFFLFGDSAGGGLALAFLQTLRDRQATNIPVRTVLQSPWLDISMSNPEIKNFIEKDVLLDFKGLKKCGRLYSGILDLKDPLVSPLYGQLHDLNHIKLFVSTHELFYPDCILLQKKLDSVRGTTIDLSIRSEMVHDWILFPIEERDETIHEIAGFLLKDS